MLAQDNTEFGPTAIIDPTDITIGGLLGFLDAQREKPLVFFNGGRAIQPGYHIAEVKAGSFAALDCGANPESWSEIFGQLWDVNEDCTHMPAGKVSAILRKVTDHFALDPFAKLTFEVSDGHRADTTSPRRPTRNRWR